MRVFEMKKLNLILITLLSTLLIVSTASAEDKLKPILDSIYNAIKALVDKTGGIIFSIFPSLQNSIEGILNSIDNFLPFMKDFHWVYYILIFIAIIAILAELWHMSRYYIINSISGIIFLLILIHVVGVEIQVTLPVLVLIVLFGIPGVLLILILHYLGIYL